MKLYRLFFAIISCLICLPLAAKPYLPAPKPPEYIYRVDPRDPEMIFPVGFQPWATTNQPPVPDRSLLHHVGGESIETRQTAWVSASGSYIAVQNLMEQMGRVSTRPEILWVYEIQPTQDTVSAMWALEDFVERYDSVQFGRRAPPPAVRAAREYLRRYAYQDEWATLGGLRTSQILRAIQFRWNGQEYEETGFIRHNRSFAPAPRPVPQTRNPISDGTREGNLYGFEVDFDQVGLASMPSIISLGVSCMGVSADQLAAGRVKRAAPDTCSEKSVVRLDAPTQVVESQLAIVDHLGNRDCLQPYYYGHPSMTAYDFTLYLKIGTCNARSTTRARYDTLGRIAFYWAGINYCVSAPSAVTSGMQSWDYITLQPCDISDKNQRWDIRDGRFYLRGDDRFVLQDWGRYAIVDINQKGYDEKLDPSRMARGFFSGPSKPADQQAEVAMGWKWGSTTYYSNALGITPWSRKYIWRTYYDYETGVFSILTTYSRAFRYGMPIKKRLTSRQAGGSWYAWNWADWTNGKDRDPVADNAVWYWRPGKRNGEVGFHDKGGNVLWVQATGQNAGFYFTAKPAKEYGGTSVKAFTIRRSLLTSS